MSEKILGYIVTDSEGEPGQLGDAERFSLRARNPKKTILYRNGNPTVFATRDSIRNAVKRTQTYAKRVGYAWYWWNSFTIHKLVKP